MDNRLAALALAATMVVAAQPAQSAVFSLFTDLASWSAAAGGTGSVQDFEGFANGTNLSGVTLLPGISATTNMDALEAFSSGGGNTTMFGIGGRAAGDARYDIAVSETYTRIAFDIDSFEADPQNSSKAQDPGQLVIFFADATSASELISGNLNGDPIFIGIIADTAITGIQWNEAHEGSGGNEETSLDNLRVIGAAVPAPSTLALLGLGLTGLAWRRRRRT